MNPERLLALAAILDRVKEDGYKQHRYFHSCGSPACALGHWAYNNRDRWTVSAFIAPRLTDQDDFGTALEAAQVEFDISWAQAIQLFGSIGCGGAKTGQEAATYIRKFVKSHQSTEAYS